MKLGIMGAMPEEVSGIVADLLGSTTRDAPGRDYVSGQWHGLDVVAVFSQWGKVAAAATATMLMAEFAVDGIIFIGVAGGVDPALDVGDVVVATDLLQYDMDVTGLGFERFMIPLLGRVRFAAHPSWAETARTTSNAFLDCEFAERVPAALREQFGLRNPKVMTGLIASGDRFVTDTALLAELRAVLPDLRCVEMEGGAVAQVCFEFDKPVAVLRVISDRADHEAHIDFPRFVAGVASVMTTHIASRFVAALAAGHAGQAA